MSNTTPTISPEAEAILYFVGLVLIYISVWNPTSAPTYVQTIFTFLGMAAVVAKYELSVLPKPQITSHQVIYSTVALILALFGGYISSTYGTEWWAGLALAVLGAVIAAYEDLGGKVPPVPTPPTPPTTPATTTTPATGK